MVKCTVLSAPSSQADYVVRLAKLLQQHSACTQYCTEDAQYGETCKKFFPRLPSLYWIMGLTPKLTTDEQRGWFQLVREFISSFKEAVRSEIAPMRTQMGSMQGDLAKLTQRVERRVAM